MHSWHIPRCYGSSGSSDKWSVRIPSLDLCSHILPELALSSSLTSLDFAYMSGFDWCLNGPLPFLGLDLWTSFLGSDPSLPQDPLRKKTNLLILSNFPEGWGGVIFLKVGEARLSIPYRTGRYGWNIPYRPAIRYTRPPCFVPEKIPAVPASYRPISGNTGRYRAYRPVQKKVFFFFFFF